VRHPRGGDDRSTGRDRPAHPARPGLRGASDAQQRARPAGRRHRPHAAPLPPDRATGVAAACARGVPEVRYGRPRPPPAHQEDGRARGTAVRAPRAAGRSDGRGGAARRARPPGGRRDRAAHRPQGRHRRAAPQRRAARPVPGTLRAALLSRGDPRGHGPLRARAADPPRAPARTRRPGGTRRAVRRGGQGAGRVRTADGALLRPGFRHPGRGDRFVGRRAGRGPETGHGATGRPVPARPAGRGTAGPAERAGAQARAAPGPAPGPAAVDPARRGLTGPGTAHRRTPPRPVRPVPWNTSRALESDATSESGLGGVRIHRSGGSAMTAPSKPISVEEFFGPPTRSRALLSPDGAKVAYLAPWRGRLNVFVRDLDSDWAAPDGAEDSGARRVTSDARRSIDTFFWSADGRYLLFQQDTDGDEN